MMTAPDQILLEYTAAVTGTFASRMDGGMISQVPLSAGGLQAAQAEGRDR
jgi:hypothetical protein